MEDFVKVKFSYWSEQFEEDAIESMWVSPLNDYYIIANIPFYVQEFALGDIISVIEKNGEYYADQLIEESGNSTIRIVFFDETIVLKIREELKTMGCNSELSDKSFLIAVNIPSEISYVGIIKPYLDKGYSDNLWDYEEACISTTQSV